MSGSITNIEFRWLRYKRRKEKHVEFQPYVDWLPWLKREVEVEYVVMPQPTLQYRLFSTGTQEWTGWMDVPVVKEDEMDRNPEASVRKLQAEYGSPKVTLTPL